MAESPKTFPAEASPLSVGKWIGRVMIAVILGEGIWGLIVSLTDNLLLPLVARTMGSDAQSPLYLGKGDFNFPALFVSVLELCFAGIVAAILYSWVQRRPRPVRSKPARVSLISEQSNAPPPAPPVAQTQGAASVPSPTPPPAAASPGQFWSPPQPSAPALVVSPPPAKVKPAKPKPPKQIYYNIAGEPVTPDDDD